MTAHPSSEVGLLTYILACRLRRVKVCTVQRPAKECPACLFPLVTVPSLLISLALTAFPPIHSPFKKQRACCEQTNAPTRFNETDSPLPPIPLLAADKTNPRTSTVRQPATPLPKMPRWRPHLRRLRARDRLYHRYPRRPRSLLLTPSEGRQQGFRNRER